MAVAEMKKLNLIAMAYDRDKILNALHRTGATEIKQHAERENTVPFAEDCDDLEAYLLRIESALEVLSARVGARNSDLKIKTDDLKDGFQVSYGDFMSARDRKQEIDALTDSIYELSDRERELLAELSKVRRNYSLSAIYGSIKQPIKCFKSTLHANIKLGVVPLRETDNIIKAVKENNLCDISVLNSDGENALILFVCHKSCAEAENLLQNFGFSTCPYFGEQSGEEICAELIDREKQLTEEIERTGETLYSLGGKIKSLKIYCDYVGFELEKLKLSDKMLVTNTTFLLEAYVPSLAEEKVSAALNEVSEAVYFEFSEPSDEEMPPTLYKNNKVVENFQTITDMYSPVNYREFDPNSVMAFFYSLFLGFIMADIGYGLMMAVCGGIIYFLKRKENGGLKRMSGVFAIGGIFAILWGVAFGSLFGLEIIEPLMPNAKDDMWSLMGINVPSVLIIAMELGIVHLMAGYVCKAIQFMRRGHFWDGILDGFVWVVFSAGVGIAIVGFVEEANMALLSYIGGGIAGGSLLIAMLTAGRKEKFFGKITKGFGAAYGIINYVSDVLSYARLYGLMLSGAVIAQIVAEYTITGNETMTGFIVSGNPLYVILGVLIFVVGHVFNLAIGLLGAYIHDARLQYVEFFGKFYEGEGELFAPLGSVHKYIKVNSQK